MAKNKIGQVWEIADFCGHMLVKVIDEQDNGEGCVYLQYKLRIIDDEVYQNCNGITYVKGEFDFYFLRRVKEAE